VLARKYRPRNFGEMVGQQHVVQALTNALTQQRLHHAYLFTGTRGVGKTTVSRILAKSLNCQGADGQGGITATPCGVCQACTDIDSGRFVDYTELDAASNRGVDEVQALLENRTVLLSGISHDLRTPITRMQLALAMLDEADPVMVRRLEADLKEMTRLIAQMLDFARSLKGEDEAEADLAQALAEMAASSSHDERVRFHAAGPCRRVLNLAALNRVVGNLVENALRYGNDGPVDLELDCAPDAVRIRVLDRGPGIPAAERDKVFQPFFRLEQSRSRDTGGSGLGLAIVRQLADAQGWRVGLLDRAGGGLVAEVTLPFRTG